MAHSPDIYNLLTGVKIDDATITDLDSATKESFINKDNAEFWRGPIFVSKVIEAGRTYPHGLPVPNASGVAVVTIEDSATGIIQPTGSEIWLVEAIDTDNTAIALTDGSNFVNFASDSEYISRTRNPIYLTKTLFFFFNNASGSQQTPSIAYHKVGL